MAYQYFSDLDLRFNIHPVTKDLVLSTDEQAITRSIKNLVLTNYYERLMQPTIGSNINAMLFEMITPLTANHVQREIYDVVTAFEPRALNVSVSVVALQEKNALSASVQYNIENTPIPIVVDILLERIR